MDTQFLTSPLLDGLQVPHGWFMRYGGVSKGLRESLNGKRMTDELDANVDKNRARAANALSRDPGTLTHIVHSFEDHILEATQPGEFTSYDASTTNNKALTLMQTTADCGSVIIADSNSSNIALVHGSWHTLQKDLVEKVAATFKGEDLVAAIGPMICQEHYEFGPEAKDIFDSKYLKSKNEKYLVDLKQMIIDQLHEAGVTKIDDVNVCTFEDERFFSARRDGQASGRLITMTALPDVI